MGDEAPDGVPGAPAPRRPWWDPVCPPGFRMSLADAIILLLAIPATWWLWREVGQWAWILPIVLAHFFLFCNVFQVGRTPELIWGALFVANVAAWECLDLFTGPRVLIAQTPITALVILQAVLRRDYQGVGYKTIRARREED